MQHCLSKRELDLLIDNNWVLSEDEEFEELTLLLQQCKYWESELVCFSYFLSQILERKAKAEIDCAPILEQTFLRSSEMWLSIQQIDAKFIHYLFRHVRDRKVSLEDSLVEVQRNLGLHIYE